MIDRAPIQIKTNNNINFIVYIIAIKLNFMLTIICILTFSPLLIPVILLVTDEETKSFFKLKK